MLKPDYIPTPEEIEESAAKIREGWDARVESVRAGSSGECVDVARFKSRQVGHRTFFDVE